MINYLFLDLETTGLNCETHDVVQLASIPIIDGVPQEQVFNQYCQPINWQAIELEALAVNHLTIAQLKTFQKPESLVNNFITFLKPFNIKFTIAGYNIDFDRRFLSALFKKVGRENEFAELFTSDTRDVYRYAKKIKSQLPTPNLKLSTLATYFGIPIDAHDALSDISATIEVDKILSKMLGDTGETIVETVAVVDKSLTLPEPAQLHCHSMYSHTDSLSTISEWVQWCLKTGTKAFSIVDHGNAASLFKMSHIAETIKKINKNNKTSHPEDAITCIPGVGLLVDVDGLIFSLNAWATSNAGYSRLVKLASIGWANKINVSDVDFPVVTLEQVTELKDDIVFGVPGLNGPAIEYLTQRNPAKAEQIILKLASVLNIRLELAALNAYMYYDPSIGGFRQYYCNMQVAINQLYWDLAKRYDIKCVPVSDAHFLDPQDKVVQDCISKNSYRDNRYFFESRHQIVSNEMYAILKSHLGETFTVEAYTALVDNTYAIAEKASSIKVVRQYHLPQIVIPEQIKAHTDDYDMQTYYFTMQRIKEYGRWNDSPEYVARFKKEIDVIMKNATLNFLPYFLMYEDICRFARSSGLLQNIARGSAGGSLLSYYLKIIHIDPVAAHLPFERFLSHARIRAGSFPDIDLDIADRARPLVMGYLKEKYNLGFAQIATFNKMKTKNAIKDAMWALYGRNRNDHEVRTVCDLIPDSPQGVDEHDFLYGYVDQEGEEHQGQIAVNEMLANFFRQRPDIESMVKKLIGSIRGWSRHASAFVVSTIDLSAGTIPTMMMDDKDLGSLLVTQYDAGAVEKCGLVKADILGIKTLTMTSDCVDLIKKNHNIDLLAEEKGVPYLYRLPDRDEGVFTDFYHKNTDSSFQFNTELIKGYAQEFVPTGRADLAIMTALCRPGALDAPLYDTTAAQYYMDVRNGKRSVEYLHADLEPILKNSNGVFIFQEEIMKFLVDVVGYSWEESDIIRSAIAKKKHEVIMATFDRIRASCKARGWTHDAIETICHQIMAFSRYSFNKSHSYAYAELGYITLWLKHHYPLEWWCSVLNNEDKEDKTRKYISYLGSKVAPPSLKYPSNIFVIKGDKIVAPLSAIRGIGPVAVNQVVAKGPFKDLADYIERIDHTRANIGAMSAFIKARAADDMMDETILDYKERRLKFIADYTVIRKNKSKFKPDMFVTDDLQLFLDERSTNQCFNRSLLSDPGVALSLESKFPALARTQHQAIPYKMGATYILSSVKVAENMLKNPSRDVEEKFGMIMLFEESERRTGKSKKTGKDWSCISIRLSDGYNTLECTDWNRKQALRFPKDSIVYVRGIIKEGWKTPVSMTISEIEQVE